MELMKEPWWSIQKMPYRFFLDTLKWKVDLEEKRRKNLEKQTKSKKTDKAHNRLQNRNKGWGR